MWEEKLETEGKAEGENWKEVENRFPQRRESPSINGKRAKLCGRAEVARRHSHSAVGDWHSCGV